MCVMPFVISRNLTHSALACCLAAMLSDQCRSARSFLFIWYWEKSVVKKRTEKVNGTVFPRRHSKAMRGLPRAEELNLPENYVANRTIIL
jgi:hypothetical protein